MAMNQEDIQTKLVEAQQLQQQLQRIITQKQQLQLKENETERALEELGKLSDESPVYKNVGGNLLVKVEDRSKLMDELQDDLESTQVRVKAIARQEDKLRKNFQGIQKELSASLSGLQQGPVGGG